MFATTSTWASERTGRFRAGDRATLTVRLPNLLTPGRYHVSPHIAHRGSGLDLMDRRPRMHDFVVVGTRASGAILELDARPRVREVDRPRGVVSAPAVEAIRAAGGTRITGPPP